MGDDRPEPQRTGRTNGSSVLTPPIGIPVVPDDTGALLEARQSADVVRPPTDPVPAVPAPAAAHIPPVVDALAGSCLCGHGAPAHEHYRTGSDCGACGPGGCSVFRLPGGHTRRVLRRLRLAR
jgi:hypothetical protein